MKKFLLATLFVLLVTSFSQAQAMPDKHNFPPAKPRMEKIVHKKPLAPYMIAGQQPPPVIVQQIPVVYNNYDTYSSSDYYSQPNITFANDKMSISIGF